MYCSLKKATVGSKLTSHSISMENKALFLQPAPSKRCKKNKRREKTASHSQGLNLLDTMIVSTPVGC